MKFEEQFPSLKDIVRGKAYGTIKKELKGRFILPADLPDIPLSQKIFFEEDLQEHCLDKQKTASVLKSLLHKKDYEVIARELNL